jgi:hypothetical protein
MSKDLINVIEDLLEEKAPKSGEHMTKKDMITNPQEKKPMKEDNIAEADQNADNAKNLTSDGKTADMATIKPGSGKQSPEVAANKGPHNQAGENAGDEGDMNKGKIASDASATVEADKGPHDQSTDNAGDTNSIDGISAKPSQASAEAEANKGPHNQSDDPGMSEETESEEEAETVDEKAKMDPVGQEDGDVDNDGDEDESDDYLKKRRNAINKAMKKEEVTYEDAMYVLHAGEITIEEGTANWDWNELKNLEEENWYELMKELTEEEESIFADELAQLAESIEESEAEYDAATDEEEAVEEEHHEKDEDGNVIEHPIEDEAITEDHGTYADNTYSGDDNVKDISHHVDNAHAHHQKTKHAGVKFHTAMGDDMPHAVTVSKGSPALKDKKFMGHVKKLVKVNNEGHDADVKTVDEALPAGEPMQKVGDAKGQDTTIQTDANIKDLPDQDKKSAKGEAETKGGDVGAGPHNQANDPHDTPTTANPAGPTKMAKASVKADANKGPHDQASDPIVNKMAAEETETDLEAELDEDFKRKAAVVFETAVNEKVDLVVEKIQADYEEKLNEEKTAISDKINEYVDYAVKEWLEENALEIKYSLRTEVAENFISGMRKLFAENYIDIPEDDISVVDELTEQIDSFKEQVEESQTLAENLQKEVLEYKKASIVEEVSSELTQTQKIRLEKLAESVDAKDTEEFQAKLSDLKEAYFNQSEENSKLLTSLSEEVIGTDEVITEDHNDSTVSAYAQFLSKTISK